MGAGLVSEAVYLAATVRLPWWRYGGALHSWCQLLGEGWASLGACLVGIGLLMIAYGVGWRVVHSADGRTPERYRKVVWGFAAVFAATLFWLMPITSDLFTYLSQAHLLTDLGINPLLHAALDLNGLDPAGVRTQDRLLLAYPTFYATSPSVYGPAWMLVSAPATLGPRDVTGGLSYLKGLAAAAYLGCAWLLERILRQVRPASALKALYLFAWNPLVLLMAVGDGHNDIVMMAAVLLAFWFLLRGSFDHLFGFAQGLAQDTAWVLAFGVLTLSVWIKWISAMFVPLFVLHACYVMIWQRPKREGGRRPWIGLGGGGLAVVAISVLVFAPFAPLEWGPGLAERLLHPVNWRMDGTGPTGMQWMGAIQPYVPAGAMSAGLLIFGVVYGILTCRLARTLRAARWHGLSATNLWSAAGCDPSIDSGQAFQQVMDVSFLLALLIFLLGAARSQPWHLRWPLALAGLSARWWAWPVVIGLSVVMLASQVWVAWGAPGLGDFAL
jgi:hypothetical protein